MAGDDGFGRLPLPPELSPRKATRARSGGGATVGGSTPTARRRRVPRWLTWTAGSLSMLVLVTSALAFGYYEKLNGNVHRVNVFGYTAHRPDKVDDGGQNILLVGSDSRVGATAAQLREASTTDDGGGINTDTIIIVHIAPDGGPVTMISFPRDSWVDIPGHGSFKINSAYADGEADHKDGGPALLTQTIENLSGLHIDHYVEVNFFQFIDISNAIGGVRVCLTKPAKDHYSGIDLPAGYSTISGSQALAFVRQRHGLPGGDLDRIKRQQRFATAMINKIKTIRNPLTWNALLEKATSSLTVDSGLSGPGLIKLADRLRGVNPADIRYVTVPVENPNASKRLSNGQNVSYVELDKPAMATFFGNIKAERDPYAAPAAGTSTAPQVDTAAAAGVHVTVLNGRRVSGAAAAAASALRGYGFQVDTLGNAVQIDTTTIRYAPGQHDAANTLQTAIPGAVLVQDDSLSASLQLVLGTDGLQVTASGTGADNTPSQPAGTASTPPPVQTAADDSCGV